MKLIDGYKLTEYMEFVDGKALGEQYPIAVVRTEHIINAPKVEAEPVRHGRWIKDKNNYIYHNICSNCKEASIYRTNYCSYCGAKMDREE